MYAIIECGGRQYRAEEGHTFSVEKLPHEVGEQIELDNVLLLSNDGNIVVGQPAVEGATVLATVTNQYRGKKIFVWKYKPKKRYRRRRGHRQSYTRLRIDSIVVGDAAAIASARAKTAEKNAAAEAAAAAKAAEDQVAAEAAAASKAEAKAKAAEDKAAAKVAAAAKAAEKKAAADAAAAAKAEAEAAAKAAAAVAEPEPTIITELDADDKTLILESDDDLIPSDDELGLGDFMDSAAAVSDAPDDATMIVAPSDALAPDELELAGLVADNSADEGTVIAQGPDFEGTILVEDLTLIEGVGPKTKEVLMMANILTFSELAATGADRLKEILKEAKLSANPSTWPEQARLAAAGEMDALKEYQDKLNGGIA